MGSDDRLDSLHSTAGNTPRGRSDDHDLDRAFDRMMSATADTGSSVKALIPAEMLKAGDGSLAELLTSALAEYEEIEKALDRLSRRDSGPGTVVEDAVAVVSDDDLADPAALERALAPLQTRTDQLEFLYARAKFGLDRLDIYHLSRMSPERLVQVMRREPNHRSVQHLVQYLHALNAAADAFEKLAIPRPHIRDYLRYLYSLADWDEMFRMVGVLQVAVDGVREGADHSTTP